MRADINDNCPVAARLAGCAIELRGELGEGLAAGHSGKRQVAHRKRLAAETILKTVDILMRPATGGEWPAIILGHGGDQCRLGRQEQQLMNEQCGEPEEAKQQKSDNNGATGCRPDAANPVAPGGLPLMHPRWGGSRFPSPCRRCWRLANSTPPAVLAILSHAFSSLATKSIAPKSIIISDQPRKNCEDRTTRGQTPPARSFVKALRPWSLPGPRARSANPSSPALLQDDPAVAWPPASAGNNISPRQAARHGGPAAKIPSSISFSH